MTAPVRLLQSLPQGTRVVVRYRIGGQLTDALGDLIALDTDSCTVRTRRGDTVVPLTDVTAAKPVPPAPPRRAPRAL
ncbi:hypothetical protein E2F48_16890 [Arthrobacter crusticola]|uniref:Histone acetyltransferase Rv0428c-like SH3 domain-containing protein n=1 Tax=Arthrobacter crusticola TaxID=2547960 RepID=A0A4R5TMN6_9MICC|nr:hypothetical protein [Arthrobacter crusticola]TDK23649.1 hypothetical protein E2F48_16890 [Arthrobacter crusticola]